MIKLNIYIDVLVLLNLYVDYVLLFATGKLCSVRIKQKRLIFGAIAGAVSSLVIILPSNTVISIIYSVLLSVIISLIAFGRVNLLKHSAVMYILSCLYTGISMLLWILSNSTNIIINNNAVYFDISPLLLIISTVLVYFTISIFKRFIFRKHEDRECMLRLEYNNKSVCVRCLIDSGNLLKDELTNNPIIIINNKCASLILGNNYNKIENLYHIKGFRIIPINSVNGQGVLTAFKPDKILAELSDKTVCINGIAAIGNTAQSEGYDAIIGLYALTTGEDIVYA